LKRRVPGLDDKACRIICHAAGKPVGGIEKVRNKQQYLAYLEELKGVREELGVDTKEELFTS